MAKESVARNNIWKWLALAIIAAVSIYVCNPPSEKFRFGLDLKGGTSFTLGVDTEKLAETIKAANTNLTEAQVQEQISKTLQGCDDRIIQVIRRRVDAMGTNEPVIQGMKDHRLLVQLPGVDADVRAAAKASLQSAAFLQFRLTHPKNEQLVAKLLAKDTAPEGYRKSGSGYARADNWAEVSKQPGYAARLASFETPDARYRFMLEDNGDGTYRPNFVSRTVELTGDSLVSAAVQRDPTTGSLSIGFQLDAEGGAKFARLTRNYKAGGPKNPSSRGRELAIILDDTLISAPVINSEISTRGEITGHFTAVEAQKLANELNAGALPAPLKILAETTVAPTVGQDAITSGKVAAVMGFALIAIFMFIYYWYAGLVADVALFLDIVLLPTALVVCANVLGVFAHDPSMGGGGSMQLPVLTMPGIAGLVLSLGMAVDANVLIFERIREEFLAGANAGKALQNGYGRAFTAILDSNLTTIITGIILFVVGTGPVRGFAITLTAGVVISMFTAVVVTRLIFDHVVDPASTKPFKMLSMFKTTPKFDFMKVTKWTVGGSFVIIVVTLAIFAIRGLMNPASVLAVDLTGGTAIVFNVADGKMPSVKEIRDTLDPFDNATVIQTQGSDQVLIKTGETAETAKGSKVENKDVGAYVTKLLQTKFPEAQFTAASVDEVGSVVGSDLKKSGTYAVLFSLIAILIYVAFRFEFGFGLGGLVALAHDALITLGLFSLCGRQVSLIVITALLTIIGYSINDTIVVFDRIREKCKMNRNPKAVFADICNEAINQCLSRTVITSVTTLFAIIALFAFGDGSIVDFALTMFIGVIAGTYSSIFIATPIMLWWYRGKLPTFQAEEKKPEAK